MDENEVPMITVSKETFMVMETLLVQFMVHMIKNEDHAVDFQMPRKQFVEWTNWIIDRKMRIYFKIDENDIIHCSLVQEIGEENVTE